MVDRVSTPQLGGRNLNELVAQRTSQQQLVRSVSGPPAAASAPDAPDPEPISTPRVPERDDAIERAQTRAQQIRAASPNIRRAAAQVDTSAQIRQLIGNAIQDATQGGGSQAQTLNAASAGSQPAAPSAPDPRFEISLGGTSGGPTAGEIGASRPGGDIETQTVVGRPPAIAENTAPNPAPAVDAPNPAPAVDAPAPETAPAVELQPQAAVPDLPETGGQESGQNPAGNSELRGDVVNVVA